MHHRAWRRRWQNFLAKQTRGFVVRLWLKYELQALPQGNIRSAITKTSSFMSAAAVTNSAAYSASTASLNATDLAVAMEASPVGIRLINFRPGVIDTPMLRATDRHPHHRKLSVCRFHAGSCQRWKSGSAATSPVTRSVVKPSRRTTSKLLR